ncbi:hypothetical protein FA95DRAFT_1487058 [Auriscalpium vulgare]|uniref:Uncharacterized protein n=1 Tax=Auriscalpium vulgare TaxID=40419 RepID=A0ACB8S328_9AGAM|nr:hypothetical protein FA95DRAFT_1487058 [Auriscalpium vulgare]
MAHDCIPGPATRATIYLQPRRQSSLSTQLRTKTVALQRYLHLIKWADTSLCPACGQQDETVYHFILECPAYEEPRRRLGQAVGRAKMTMDHLLAKKNTFPKLSKFIHETKRFEDAFGDVRDAGRADGQNRENMAAVKT